MELVDSGMNQSRICDGTGIIDTSLNYLGKSWHVDQERIMDKASLRQSELKSIFDTSGKISRTWNLYSSQKECVKEPQMDQRKILDVTSMNIGCGIALAMDWEWIQIRRIQS